MQNFSWFAWGLGICDLWGIDHKMDYEPLNSSGALQEKYGFIHGEWRMDL
jgi:hypothetical protein